MEDKMEDIVTIIECNSPISSLVLTSAPCSKRILTTSMKPFCAANIRLVSPINI